MPKGLQGFQKGHKPYDTPESRAKRSKSLTGKKRKPFSKETRKKMSKARKGKFVGENGHSWKGGKPKCLICEKQLENRKAKHCVQHSIRKGKDNPRWKGGYENRLWHNNKRRMMKLGNGGSHTLGDWENIKAQYNWTCPRCKIKEPEIVLSRDHIVPVSRGGSDNIENIQPLCRGCNSTKRTKTIFYNRTWTSEY